MTDHYYSGPKLSYKKIMKLYKKKRIVVHPDGYEHIYLPEHLHSKMAGYIRLHRVVMEEKLGRFLKLEERVHHINGIKTDNRPENLQYFPNESSHQSSIPRKYKYFIWKGRKKEYDKEWYLRNRDRVLRKQKLRRQTHQERSQDVRTGEVITGQDRGINGVG